MNTELTIEEKFDLIYTRMCKREDTTSEHDVMDSMKEVWNMALDFSAEEVRSMLRKMEEPIIISEIKQQILKNKI